MISRNNQKFSDPASAVRYLRFKGNVDPGGGAKAYILKYTDCIFNELDIKLLCNPY